MANHSRSRSQDFANILGLGSVCRACKSFVSKCYSERNPSPKKLKAKDQPKPRNQDHHHQAKLERNQSMNEVDDLRYHHEKESLYILQAKRERNQSMNEVDDLRYHHGKESLFNYLTHSPPSTPPASRGSSPPRLSRSTSQKPMRRTSTLSRTMSRRISVDSAALPRSLSRCGSRSSTPIMYSNSNGLMKPPPMEQTLHCTLEELCFGCIKKINITRDAVTNNGQIIQEKEVLTIKVKPGWTKGTKVTFEGMGNEVPGTDPADVIFVISEKEHSLFRREGDDLALAVEVPLVAALTGATISIPLLDGNQMSFTVNDIIYPGYRKIIIGQGMPQAKEPGNRGNLTLTFNVEFPVELTDEQRSEVATVLEDAF